MVVVAVVVLGSYIIKINACHHYNCVFDSVFSDVLDVIKWVTCSSSVVFSEYSSVRHWYNWPPWYYCNIVESGVKHQ